MEPPRELFDFFSFVFNADWGYDFESDDAAIDDYIAKCPADYLKTISTQLENLLGAGLSDHELDDFTYSKLDVNFDPTERNMTTQEWLGHVLRKLLVAIETK